jgi:transaldolase / glucose-6-phosphate isomerase
MDSIIKKLTALGQSLWYDNIQRKLLENGEFAAMIARGDIRGVTSNPSIFNNAISKSTDYDAALVPLAWAGWDAEKIFWELVVEDIKEACRLFHPLYEETNGGDGYVSIEVSPFLSNDTAATAAQAQQLWARVAKPNLMVKIPATKAGLPAIRSSTAAGININITLIFSLARYAEVMEAYISGLEDRLAAGHPIDHIDSVASFFVSRVDTKVDGLLPEGSVLRGQAAIANAKIAYENFQKVFSGERWEKLLAQGAHLQRPLWASTSTKNPAYADTMYVDNLVGAHTVNTVPPATLEAVRDHGRAEITISKDVDIAHQLIADLEAAGVSMDQVTRELEEEGVKAFSDAITGLLKTLDERRMNDVSALGPLAGPVSKRIAQLERDSVVARLWARDPNLWTKDPAEAAEVRVRMGWLDSPEKARGLLSAYQSFADQIRKEGLGRILVLGMGGSSLTAEVFSSLLAATDVNGPACLAILDSTDPAQVAKAAQDYPPEKSLYFLASKSGGTAEVNANFDYFWKLSHADSSRFVATTDSGTSLEILARERGFRKIFSADETVGGRYSALTDFGMVPAALLGYDLARLLDRADWMRRQCYKDIPPARNPGLALGAVLGESALAGRDKLTLVADKPLQALAGWIEQIIAESSGKNGKGILPVPLEPLDVPEVYDADRLFVYLRQTGELANGITTLRAAGYPVIEFAVSDPYDAGGEFFRWEVATAVACHIVGVNAFNQPDVQESKDRTKAKITEYRSKGKLAEGKSVELSGAKIALAEFLARARPGDYVAINAYVARDAQAVDELQRMRVAIREKTRCAVTAGFGPRFQHSTGQFHKGGPNTGLFIQIITDAVVDIPIPNEGLTFGTLIRAQALGDYETLIARGRRVIRIRLEKGEALHLLVEALLPPPA